MVPQLRKFIHVLVSLSVLQALPTTSSLPEAGSFTARNLPFHLHARAENKDGSIPVYKDSAANIEDRISDLLARMTVEEKVSQLQVDLRSALEAAIVTETFV